MKIENYLCSNAHPSAKKFDPGACQTCVSPCGHGLKWLSTMGMPLPKRQGRSQAEIHYLPRTEKLKMILNKGC